MVSYGGQEIPKSPFEVCLAAWGPVWAVGWVWVLAGVGEMMVLYCCFGIGGMCFICVCVCLL